MKTFILATAIARAGRESINTFLEKYNINTVEYYILYFLQKKPGSTQYQILKYTMQTKSRINQIITKLESMGYLEKKVELVGSLLKKPLYNTEEGDKIVALGIKLINENIMDHLAPNKREKYDEYNKILFEILEDISQKLNVEVLDIL
jgi:DNA-binding MarR family transcriptional regulator